MTKATHHGECQICGRLQKLPSGLLSLHGYTTRWGFFEGTCPGSQHKPFEQSFDMIEVNMKAAERRAVDLRTEAHTQEKGKGELLYHKYIGATWQDRCSRYVWVKVKLVKDEVVFEDGATKSTMTLCGYRIEQDFRNKRATWLHHEAKKYDGYVSWQQERIQSWKPRELKTSSSANH